jgi:hypothetical protein
MKKVILVRKKWVTPDLTHLGFGVSDYVEEWDEKKDENHAGPCPQFDRDLI